MKSNLDFERKTGIAIVSIAAKEEGYESVPYPLEHALVYFLKHNRFPFKYSFNWHYCLREAYREWLKEYRKNFIEYPHSLELAEDLMSLSASGILKMKASATAFLPGPVSEKKRDLYIQRFDKESPLKFSQVRRYVKQALAHPKTLLDQCYVWYINEI